ncbi:hypothetical protein [Azohydromonas aeria]|nr:hypothetical protein [Azohydromonas aeria]
MTEAVPLSVISLLPIILFLLLTACTVAESTAPFANAIMATPV